MPDTAVLKSPRSSNVADSVTVTAFPASAYADMGKPAKGEEGKCTVDIANTSLPKCKGFLGLDFDTGDPKALAKGVKAMRFVGVAPWIPRRPSDNNAHKSPELKIKVIEDARQLPLKEVGRYGVVIGQITAKPGSWFRDYRYNVASSDDKKDEFYLVVSDFRDRDDDQDGKKGSRGFATWKIYGIQKAKKSDDDAVVYTADSGVFRYCATPHEGWEGSGGADFLTCPKAAGLHAVERQASSVSREGDASLFDILRVNLEERKLSPYVLANFENALRELTPKVESFDAWVGKAASAYASAYFSQWDDTAWLRCGGGCCTASEL